MRYDIECMQKACFLQRAMHEKRNKAAQQKVGRRREHARRQENMVMKCHICWR